MRGGHDCALTVWLALSTAASGASEPPIPNGRPFHLGANIIRGSALDVSFLLHRPAGRDGVVRAHGERLVFGDGSPARFWGVNICWEALYPDREQARAVAARLAMSGANLARLTYWDGGPHGIFRQDVDNTSTIDPQRLDRLEYFVSQLKSNGVYVLLVLGMGRSGLKPGDVGRSLTNATAEAAYPIGRFFDAEIRCADENIWRQLLDHRNPYTDLRWADEPAIAAIEILNEGSLYYKYTLCEHMPDWLAAQMRRAWNQWLTGHYSTRTELEHHWGHLGADEDPWRGTVRLDFSLLRAPLWRSLPGEQPPREGRGNDWNRFLADQCRSYYETEIAFLRRLGAEQLIACNGGGSFAAADKWSNLVGDLFTQHSYHDHPQWDGPMFYRNRSALKTGLRLVQNFARGRLAGKPYGISEYDFCFPNDWRAEGGPVMAAYGALQDWSLMARFAYWAEPWDDRDQWYSPQRGIRSIWRIHNDPAAFGQWPVTALMFLRGDIQPGRRVIDIGFSAADTFFRERARFPGDRLEFLGDLALVHRTRQALFEGAYHGDGDLVVSSGRSSSGDYSHAKRAIVGSAYPWADLYGLQPPAFRLPADGVHVSADELRRNPSWFHDALRRLDAGGDGLSWATHDGWVSSDTRELRYHRKRGLLVIDSPRTQGAVGFGGGITLSTRDARFTVENEFATLLLSSVDGLPLRLSARILVVAVGRCQNATFQRRPTQDDRYEATGKSLGEGPILVEPIRFDMSLRRAPDSLPLVVHALDGSGRRVAVDTATVADDRLVWWCDGDPATIYYELATDSTPEDKRAHNPD